MHTISQFNYLKTTIGKRDFVYRGRRFFKVEGYTDIDWAKNVGDRRSTSGFFTFVGGNLVRCRSNKQNVISHSSAEAKYQGMVIGLQELLWLKLLTDLDYPPRELIVLYCDNKAVCDIA